MEKRNYKALAREFKQLIKGCTKATADKVVVDENGIDIFPAKTNDSGTFYHTEELIDFCRFRKLSNWVGVYQGKTWVHIY